VISLTRDIDPPVRDIEGYFPPYAILLEMLFAQCFARRSDLEKQIGELYGSLSIQHSRMAFAVATRQLPNTETTLDGVQRGTMKHGSSLSRVIFFP
jgi:hypothetical protein